MRPRLITAENARKAIAAGTGASGFNEAAAHHRGERDYDQSRFREVAASMRPRLITAENVATSRSAACSSSLQ